MERPPLLDGPRLYTEADPQGGRRLQGKREPRPTHVSVARSPRWAGTDWWAWEAGAAFAERAPGKVRNW